jgi:hypothetical protein
LGLSPVGLVSIIFLSLSEREREREREKAGSGSERDYIFFFCLNPLLFASCTDTFSKWCKIIRGMKRSAQ